jgi:hypothetical protein
MGQDYGYRPAVDAIVDRLKEALTGKCLPRTLTPDKTTGKIPCSIIEVRPKPPSGAPACTATPGRSAADPKVIGPVEARLAQTKACGVTGKPACDTGFYYCAIDEAGADCHQNQSPNDTGWCYVDPAAPGSTDDPSLVAKCPATEQRIIRFVDPMNATPAHDATVLIACFGSSVSDNSM